ncbi:MAG: four-carbon acid sugar kinase family protein [Rhodobacteraceae bacterium]|nr:four-carbon acid sugar kinase family protein [Paracoccaceae bacterium]
MIAADNTLPEGVLVAWYGDDFTGSAAVMEALSFGGLPSVLFLDIPTLEQLQRFQGLRGIGIASTARSHGNDWMDINLPAAFEWLAGLRAPITHYKVCSTLDSAPHVGSIGKAIDLAMPSFKGRWVPCLIAAPAIRRYQAFGNLFGAAPGGVFRLDRHPVMARHPVTPMDEADVTLHLAKQTTQTIGLVDLEALQGHADEALRAEIARGAKIVCIDTVTADDLSRAGELIWRNREDGLFAVGSQGVEYALLAHWRNASLLEPTERSTSAGPVERIIAVSGSVSATTSAQVNWAEENGFDVVRLDPVQVIKGDAAAEKSACEQALQVLSAGRDPLILTARGPDDPTVEAVHAAVSHSGTTSEAANAKIGAALGSVLAQLLKTTGLKRAVISGGDTSGHAMRQLDLFALTALSPTIPGAALLQGHSETKAFDGLQLALKGGQMGSPDYFGWIKQGGGTA